MPTISERSESDSAGLPTKPLGGRDTSRAGVAEPRLSALGTRRSALGITRDGPNAEHRVPSAECRAYCIRIMLGLGNQLRRRISENEFLTHDSLQAEPRHAE